MLKYALVNDYNINEVFEITKDEMFELTDGRAIFMCMKDTERLSAMTPMGVLAFHPIPSSAIDPEEAWSQVCEVIMEVRTARGEDPVKTEPLLLASGQILHVTPTPPSDPRLN